MSHQRFQNLFGFPEALTVWDVYFAHGISWTQILNVLYSFHLQGFAYTSGTCLHSWAESSCLWSQGLVGVYHRNTKSHSSHQLLPALALLFLHLSDLRGIVKVALLLRVLPLHNVKIFQTILCVCVRACVCVCIYFSPWILDVLFHSMDQIQSGKL